MTIFLKKCSAFAGRDAVIGARLAPWNHPRNKAALVVLFLIFLILVKTFCTIASCVIHKNKKRLARGKNSAYDGGIAMKKLLLCALVVLLVGEGLFAETPDDSALQKDSMGRWNYARFAFTAKAGEWTQARNWGGGKLPAPPLPRANIGGISTVTLSQPFATPVSILSIGPEKAGTASFYFKPGAVLQTGGIWMPNANVPGSVAHLYMEGGELTVGDLKAHSYFLDVGFGTTASGGARFVLSGGKLKVGYGLRVGSNTPQTNTGAFVVQGSRPAMTVATDYSRGIELQASGVLEFVLDANGVSTIDASKAKLTVHPGCVIRANGKAYTGGSKTIVLVQAASVAQSGKPQMEAMEFSSAYHAQVTMEKNRVVLKIAKGG